jgi:hypothetical protein
MVMVVVAEVDIWIVRTFWVMEGRALTARVEVASEPVLDAEFHGLTRELAIEYTKFAAASLRWFGRDMGTN